MKNKINFLLTLGVALASLSGCGQKIDNNVLVVGMECDYAPFNWTSPSESEYTLPIDNVKGQYCDGYDVQIARYLSEELEMEVKIKKIAWDSLIPSLQSNSINCIIAGMSYDTTRDETVDFTSNYYTSDLTMVVRSDSPLANATSIQDFKGYKVGSQLGTLTDTIIDQIEGVEHVTPYETFGVCALAVASGTIDAMTAEYPVALAIVGANPSLKVVSFSKENGFVSEDENALGVAVAVKEGNKELQEKIDTALKNLDSERRNELMEGAVSRSPRD